MDLDGFNSNQWKMDENGLIYGDLMTEIGAFHWVMNVMYNGSLFK